MGEEPETVTHRCTIDQNIIKCMRMHHVTIWDKECSSSVPSMGIMTPSLNGIRSISILSAEVGRDIRMRRQVCCKCVLKRAEKYVLWNKSASCSSSPVSGFRDASKSHLLLWFPRPYEEDKSCGQITAKGLHRFASLDLRKTPSIYCISMYWLY